MGYKKMNCCMCGKEIIKDKGKSILTSKCFQIKYIICLSCLSGKTIRDMIEDKDELTKTLIRTFRYYRRNLVKKTKEEAYNIFCEAEIKFLKNLK